MQIGVNQKRKKNFFKGDKMNIESMDFVYIIKPGEKGTDLRYSLRSIAKHYPNNKVWIIGYKPTWVTNVEYLPVKQTGTKWSNSTNNVIEACKCEAISEDFILMNDDFFCIDPTLPLEIIIDSSLGLIDDVIDRYKKMRGDWAKGFIYINELMDKLKLPKPYYSYEAHLPLRINKEKFLEVISLPEVQKFMQTSKVLHKRTLYKNYDRPEELESHAYQFIHDENIVEGFNMRFDVIIGNPPYQEDVEGNERDNPIYNYFMDEAYKNTEKAMFITPARFLFNAGQTSKAWNKKMLQDSHFKVVYFNQDASTVFPNVILKGGVSISYHDTSKHFEPIEVFVPYDELRSIKDKVLIKERGNKFLPSIMVGAVPYKFSETFRKERPELVSKTGTSFDLRTNAIDNLIETAFLLSGQKNHTNMFRYTVC